MAFLRVAFKTLRLSLTRVGMGWMFALLYFNFNRVTIADLGAVAVIVTTLLALHHFLSPFQIVWGRLADCYPIFGYRRTPHIVLSALVCSLLFLLLPSLAVGLGARSPLATLLALLVFIIFGLAIAANGTAIFALIAETTTERERGIVVGITHSFTILSSIFSAVLARQIMPEYSPEQMQLLYNLTPLITFGGTLVGVIGLERRISPAQHAALLAQARQEQPGDHPFRIALRLLRTNWQVRAFFAFVLLSILGIFLQDAILEVFGKEVFNLSVKETTHFTEQWGGGVLLGMLLMGVLSALTSLSKKALATVGGCGTALGLATLALASLTRDQAWLLPALWLMGFSVGLFNIGAMAMMMEMTVAGHTGLYMGLWGMAQGLGNGLANVLSGALHTQLIETELLPPFVAYGWIFGVEAVLMLLAILVLRSISVQEFKNMDYNTLTNAMALDAAH